MRHHIVDRVTDLDTAAEEEILRPVGLPLRECHQRVAARLDTRRKVDGVAETCRVALDFDSLHQIVARINQIDIEIVGRGLSRMRHRIDHPAA